MKKRLLWQIFPSYLIIVLLALAAFAVNNSFLVESFLIKQTRRMLEVRAQLVQEAIEPLITATDPVQIDSVCKKLGRQTQTRITVIESTGRVLGESEHNPQTMENHLSRPEVEQALTGGVGYSESRSSTTLSQRMMYVAVPVLHDGQVVAVVRTSLPLTEIQQTLHTLTHSVIQYGIVIVLVLAGVSLWYAWRLSRPLMLLRRGAEEFAQGRLNHKLTVAGNNEISDLATTMNDMAQELDRRIQTSTRQQNQQQAVFAAMLEGVIAFDSSGKCLTLNVAAARLLGVEAAGAIGRTIGEIIRNSDLQLFVNDALQNIQPAEEIFLTSDTRQELYLQVRASALLDSSNRHIGALIVLNDMTRIYRLEQVRKDFVANVSHELKTPITSIHGFIETLRDGAINNPEDAKRFLDIIARQTDRLNSIIEDLLLLCELEQQDDTVRVPRQVCDIRNILNSAVDLCRHKAEGRNIQLEISCPSELKTSVNASLLEQAVLNLADNAVKYSNPGGKVLISADNQQDTLTIRIQDFGCGIAPEHQGRIFERFYRVDKARSRQLGGTGLGLAIVKHIAQYHQGAIRVESTPGKGSIFILTLPIRL